MKSFSFLSFSAAVAAPQTKQTRQPKITLMEVTQTRTLAIKEVSLSMGHPTNEEGQSRALTPYWVPLQQSNCRAFHNAGQKTVTRIFLALEVKRLKHKEPKTLPQVTTIVALVRAVDRCASLTRSRVQVPIRWVTSQPSLRIWESRAYKSH